MNKVKAVTRLIAFSLVTVVTSGFAITEEDSVHSWGPWTTLVKPAAGPQVPTPTSLAGPVVPGFGAGDTSQFTAIVTTPGSTSTPPVSTTNDICVAGSACNYALIYSRPNARGANQTSLQTATASLNPIPVRQQVDAPQGDGLAVLNVIAATPIETSLTISSTTSLPLSIAINNVLVNFNDATRWQYSSDNGDQIQGSTVDIGGSSFAYGSSGVNGDNNRIIGTFIVGDSTALGDLDAFRLGEVEASYEGFTLGSGTDVAITVDFGAGTWNGSWNDGADGGVRAVMGSDGVNVLTGTVGFEAIGTISGANLVSTQVGAADATTISGNVTGTFFGGQAGALGGAVNINKATQTYAEGNYQDLYVTSKNVTLPRADVR